MISGQLEIFYVFIWSQVVEVFYVMAVIANRPLIYPLALISE